MEYKDAGTVVYVKANGEVWYEDEDGGRAGYDRKFSPGVRVGDRVVVTTDGRGNVIKVVVQRVKE